ncbi:MAG: RusA family crossover junction endodeoxyribonuclease [Planctomycetota bacterium]
MSSELEKMHQLWIPGPLPGLNEILSERMVTGKPGVRGKKWNQYSKTKREWGQRIGSLAQYQKFPKIRKGANFIYTFMELTRRRDPSNVFSGGIKLIEDGLQVCGLLRNDNWEYVKGVEIGWGVDKVNPGCLVCVWYDEEEK